MIGVMSNEELIALPVHAPTVFEIGLSGVVVADLELSFNSWIVGVLGQRLQYNL